MKNISNPWNHSISQLWKISPQIFLNVLHKETMFALRTFERFF